MHVCLLVCTELAAHFALLQLPVQSSVVIQKLDSSACTPKTAEGKLTVMLHPQAERCHAGLPFVVVCPSCFVAACRLVFSGTVDVSSLEIINFSAHNV